MIGAMPAMAVRHERRKKKPSVFSGILPEGVPGRPAKLVFKPHHARDAAGGGGGAGAAAEASASVGGADADLLTSPAGPSTASAPGRFGSRAASLAATSPQLQDGCGSAGDDSRQGTPTHKATRYRYGDECCYGKVSLLHFITFSLLGGLTFVVVGAVQFKKDAGFSNFRYHFLVLGSIFLAVGLLLVVIKCVWFRIAYPIVAYVDEDGSVNNAKTGGAAAGDSSKPVSPAGEKKDEISLSHQRKNSVVAAAVEKKKNAPGAEKDKEAEEKKRLLV